ncbi:MAG: hypothetical protein L0Y66_08205 [Myxococcaceae bacterium]|nr:hypothetical protein [Myxococcaceae bacterium]MCI0668860.1 hypothetical protein [Myxococcaceae bacterium]
MRMLRLALVSLVTLAACEPPPVVPTADKRQNSSFARVEGSVVVQSAARGNVVVLLYSASRPPPPQGTGRPMGFTFLSAEEVFGDDLVPAPGKSPSSGPFTARFSFDTVPEGSYLLRGFIDSDTCIVGADPCRPSDWLPWYSVTAEVNAGDVGGAAVDPLTLQPRIIEVREEGGQLVPVDQVTVTFSDSAHVPIERPSFKVELLPSDTSVLDVSSAQPKVVILKPLAVKEGSVSTAPPAFMLRYEGFDATGKPLDTNGDGIPEVWPKVLVRKLTDTPHSLTEENDLNSDGVLDAEGVEYPLAPGLEADGAPDRVVLAAGFLPETLAALHAQDGKPLAGTDGKPLAVPVTQLQLAITKRALDARDLTRPLPLAAIPAGRYGITLVSFTGQTWKVPNELDPDIAEPLGLPEVQGQEFTVQVPLR